MKRNVAINWDQKTGECQVIPPNVVDVVDHGAVGDGIADDTQLDGNIVAPDMASWTGDDKSKWIVFSNVQGLSIIGDGTIDGRGSNWWQSNLDAHQRPIGTMFQNCNKLQLQGFTHINSGSLHISIADSNGVSISNLHVFAPESSPNTDGIDISRSSNVDIRVTDIGTGDDCIAIGGGSSYINITSVSCGPGHGISIGSLGANGGVDTVEQVSVKNCTLAGTTNGARIKTWQGGSGFARRILFNEITLTNVTNPILIDQFYCPYGTCINETSAVEVSDVSFIGFHGTSSTENAITLECSEIKGCSNIILDDINIVHVVPGQVTQASCFNAHGTSGVTTPAIDCLSA
ncbi:hypothetical protein HS088_TW10G00648 [Tripterygium wilfordii]|uniref:Polygalacturonase n=1 Tax=Tripterygium wilfordii TaxID=458696 RepID=A0A7J7D5P7_TRIWF|nr:hypothetical protein HS088_TW10G00648 [Tripterygium wilfordii]